MGINGYTNPTALPELPQGWAQRAVEEICENVTTGGTPSRSNPLFYQGNFNWFKTGELKDCFLENSEEKITGDALENSSAKLFPPETVLMAMYGDGKTITSLGILRKEAASNQACCAMIANRKVCVPRFLFYALRHHREDFIRLATGGAQRNLSGKLIRRFALNTPPLSEQRAIAAVLGSLDDKIELNRQMNETLEALAQSLFKSWFVDATQSALPKGWRAGTLGEVAENLRRGIQPDEIKPDTAYIGLEHMPRRCIALSDWGQTEELESGKFEFKRGEILFGKLRPYFHKVGVAPLDGVCSTDILVVTPKEPAWFGFVLGYVSSVELVNHTNAASTGTKMPRANWNDISRYVVALPPKQLAAEFTEKTHPLVERIISNIYESRTLAALRDALLPKLLSGELRVPAAAQLVEATA